MKTLTIAVIAGDGVGLEVVPQAKRVLEQAAHKHNLTLRFRTSTGAHRTFSAGGR
jgi:isocitrate/isopropylmalate dehydrogenase